MGIKFYCDSCQRKLNVKSFLAGKRGVCPHCGSKVDIPLESQIPSRKKRDDVMPGPAKVNGNAAAAVAAVSPVAAATATIPAAPAVASATVPVASPGPIAPAAVTPAPAADPIIARGVPAAPTAPADPLSEAPNAVWYVRPPSGGQYGPARCDVMRKWISEGRVSSDSLVWREGWEDWKTAGPLFPSLNASVAAAASPPSPVSAPVAPVAGAVASSLDEPGRPRPSTRRRRRNNNGLAVAVVVTLVMMSVALLGVLFWVLSNQ